MCIALIELLLGRSKKATSESQNSKPTIIPDSKKQYYTNFFNKGINNIKQCGNK